MSGDGRIDKDTRGGFGDTIAAVSTAPGEGGIGIIRISGSRALEILGQVFEPKSKLKGGGSYGWSSSDGGNFSERRIYYGYIAEPASGERVDEVLCFYMRGPRSYTGEDVCEIQCHGGGVPLRRILGLVCECGAVPAQPGEFTKRAFLNGRLDLAQAGAVIDLIRSKTERGYIAAREQAEGRLSERVREARGVLLDVLAEIAAMIDYPEEYVGVVSGSGEDCGAHDFGDMDGALAHVEEIVCELLEGAAAGRVVRDGVRIVIVGKPNVGKSSLFNALAREDAAIVTAAPGTTRDALEVWLDVRGVPVLLIDTAGMREGVGLDEVERLGIERAQEQYERADVCLFVLDGSEPLSEEDSRIARDLDSAKKHIVVVNKGDLGKVVSPEDVETLLGGNAGFRIQDLGFSGQGKGQETDSIDRENLAELEERLAEVLLGGVSAGASLLVTKARHKALLESAAAELKEARSALDSGAAAEFFEVNIRAARGALGEIIGEEVTDDVIDRVFEEFCVGK